MSKAVRYRVVNKIAHGGMAEIFLAMQIGAEGFKKPVVLKRILPQLAADPQFVRMLVDEAHIASTLNHSNLVQVLDLGKSGDQYFLVLEFVDGWSLEQVRRRAQKLKMKLPLPLTLYVMSALCRALAYVHTRRGPNGRSLEIVHRDVTPQNVLLSREGEVKLADFGIAKAIGKSERSATGVIKGKFAYMSPEQSMGSELDGRSDLFSVGTLLYLLTTGRKPFEAATDLDTLMLVRKARYEKPSELFKDFNEDVERFIARALRSDRSRRWQTAEQMADRLDAILVKLGQPSGPAALKRWLDNLSNKDGVRPPAELQEAEAASATIELGSGDLELQDVSPPPEEEPPTRADPATRAEARQETRQDKQDKKGTRATGRAVAVKDRDREREDVRTRAEPPRVLTVAEAVAATPTRATRFRRWVVRVTVRTVLLLVVLGSGAYFARPYLPAWLVQPVENWVRELPGFVGLGSGVGDGDVRR
jgi:eukaryotic-like serine/threonine-protein kinase